MSDAEDMPKHPRLALRGGTYWHRAAVPADIRATYPKREETFSLRTKDPREALRKVRIAAVQADQRFEAHRRQLAALASPMVTDLSPDQIKAIRTAYHRHLLEEDEAIRLQGFVEIANPSEGQPYVGPLHDAPRDTFEEHVEKGEVFAEGASHDLARGKVDDFWADEVDEVLSWNGIGINLSPASPARPLVARALQEAAILAAKGLQQRNRGEVVDTPPAAPLVAPSATPLLSAAVSEWVAEKSRTWGQKAAADNRAWLAIFVEVVGDKPLSEYRKADGTSFKTLLLALPANAKKHRELRGLSIAEAANRAKELGMAPMSVANLNKAINRVQGFWNWAEGNFEGIPPCPLKAMKMKDGKAKTKRHPLTTEQLQAILTSPLYVGCKSTRSVATAGDLAISGHWKFWLPLLGLFTGARANELGQLRPSDVKTFDGIACLDIREDDQGQRVKESASNRLVPIHQSLVDLGFLTLVADRKASGAERLFPELRQDKMGYFSDAISDFFSGYLKALGIKTPKTSFHSLRHNFQDACRFASIDMRLTEALAGREDGTTGGIYGRGEYAPKQLNDNIQRITYPDLNLSHLPTYVQRSGG